MMRTNYLREKLKMIQENRWNHILGVARRAKDLAAKLQPDNPQYAEDMFLLGILHDFAYEFRGKGHALAGGEILKRNGYRYWREVSEHGHVENVNLTDELFILDCADMTTSPSGENMSFEQRAEEIAMRFGSDSEAYLNVLQEIDMLKKDKRYETIFAEK